MAEPPEILLYSTVFNIELKRGFKALRSFIFSVFNEKKFSF